MGDSHYIARDLCRSVDFEPATADDESTGRNLTGYAAVFGAETEIDSWEGRFTEFIRKGAFRKSLRERTPVMQFDHGRHPLIGSIPIGRIEDVREDDHGLYTEATLSDNWLVQPIRDAIAERSVSGMSFRFEVVREQWYDEGGKKLTPQQAYERMWMSGPDAEPLRRELIELKVRELGPVVFPAYDQTEVGVRAAGMAHNLITTPDLVREIRRSLAQDSAAMDEVPEDPELRREVATALLLRNATPSPAADDAPVDDHPDSSSDGAPAVSHPPNERTQKLRAHIREITALMGDTIAALEDKES
ncbi:HK97 family phage prohead protease [Streptomyces lycii]|uniref:HK97 family phage prohead protease n=1 Tax=Streptomyces lycii TaxID=2654337 RepID=A0ABQ7FIK0_9ACTN|nr:HK97 family phage prohead protease [Streptomyces lycii]KAF4408660.1 HK97 family phage prohead protease [Streptomyces lycii]